MNSDEKIKLISKVEPYIIGAGIVFSVLSMIWKFFAVVYMIFILLVHIGFMWITGNIGPNNYLSGNNPKPPRNYGDFPLKEKVINIYPVLTKEENRKMEKRQWQKF